MTSDLTGIEFLKLYKLHFQLRLNKFKHGQHTEGSLISNLVSQILSWLVAFLLSQPP